jgi:pseudouridine synthase
VLSVVSKEFIMKTRLQRFLADCGVASRRECEEMIEAGRVRVNGEIKTRMPVMIDPAKDVITVDDEEISVDTGEKGLEEQQKVYFLLNKPKGILVTNNDPSDRKTVGELLSGIPERVFPVGRLDMDSRGALIMTNDGELANRLTHPRYGIEKTYIVEVDGRVGHEDLEKIKRGMWLGPERAGPNAAPALRGERGGRPQGATRTERFKVKLVGRERGRTILELKISEGKNREIRRVMARIGHVVRDLNRVAIAGKVTIKGLDVGKFRPLTEQEVKWLYKASSPEFHASQKNATQAWYEAKEMEKERKRLEREADAAKEAAAAAPGKAGLQGASKKGRPAAAEEEEFRPRPERKGKKPFIPPTGRNAGKPLGGNFIGKQRLEREQRQSKRPQNIDESVPPPHEDTPTIKSEVHAEHPLGDAAQSDD